MSSEYRAAEEDPGRKKRDGRGLKTESNGRGVGRQVVGIYFV